jgi:hypothetical protein
MDTVFEHEGHIYIEMEVCIDILLKRVEAMGMELEIFGQDMNRNEYTTTKSLAKGLTFAALCLTNEYIAITPREDRREFYSAMTEQMQKIVEGNE